MNKEMYDLSHRCLVKRVETLERDLELAERRSAEARGSLEIAKNDLSELEAYWHHETMNG